MMFSFVAAKPASGSSLIRPFASSRSSARPPFVPSLGIPTFVTPHAEILAAAKDTLAAEGITLDIIEFNDYVQPNLALESGDLDANFFQHQPYLDLFNQEHDTDLVSIAAVHFEPMSIYAGVVTDLSAVSDASASEEFRPF